MADRGVIKDISGMLEDIRDEFQLASSQRGIFARRNDLDRLLREVEVVIAGHIVYEPDNRIKPVACQHKWRDFDYWYMDYETRNKGLNFTVYEPYLCIHCGERKNVILDKGRIAFDEGDTEESVVSEICKLYPKIRPRGIVEDEINDAVLVDREYLRIADYLRGNGKNAYEIKLKLGGVNDGA